MGLLKLVSIIILIGLFACSPQAETEYMPVNFVVNSDALGSLYSPDYSPFSFNFPLDVKEIDSVEAASFIEMVSTDTNAYFNMELLKVERSHRGMVVTVSLIDSSETVSKIIDENYLNQLKTTFDSVSAIRNKILINKISAIQFILTSQEYINIKLYLLLEPNIIQVDYFIPGSQYYELLEQIESSIGSISLINKEEKR